MQNFLLLVVARTFEVIGDELLIIAYTINNTAIATLKRIAFNMFS